MIVLMKKTNATTIVNRVRFRSTMWVPPCDAGVKPIPPRPVSRPECMRMSETSANETITWKTATIASSIDDQDSRACYVRDVDENARARIQKLLVTGDNRLKQGVEPERVRESYERALALAREVGLEEKIAPLVTLRLEDLERLKHGGAPQGHNETN
jgi:hypothetical protein